jgi:hypothetical protein
MPPDTRAAVILGKFGVWLRHLRILFHCNVRWRTLARACSISYREPLAGPAAEVFSWNG